VYLPVATLSTTHIAKQLLQQALDAPPRWTPRNSSPATKVLNHTIDIKE
jgi:hypothetical protein